MVAPVVSALSGQLSGQRQALLDIMLGIGQLIQAMFSRKGWHIAWQSPTHHRHHLSCLSVDMGSGVGPSARFSAAALPYPRMPLDEHDMTKTWARAWRDPEL